MLHVTLLLILFPFFVGWWHPTEKPSEYEFKDPALPLDVRINDLISRLTLEQKASMMLYNSPAIDNLGIPAYNWWNECLHGVARAGKATVFPQAIGLAATFDDSLIYRVAAVISSEARAKFNVAAAKNNRAQYAGLSFWAPNINIFRDPRWGRGQETYGEDPFLTSRLGVAFVRGLQGEDPKYLKAAACAKHFAVHSGPENIRHKFNALPEERDFRETYLLAFKSLVDAKVEAVMCAYNRLYDLPCCGSPYLLYDILRKEWSFKGHIVSDCWAPDDFFKTHKVVKTEVEAAAMAANAGVNLNCGYTYKVLPDAVKQGLVTENTIDSILRPLLRTRFRLGLFDPDSLNPYSAIDPAIVDCDKHRQLAYEAAAKSIVLLKNNGILPLRGDTLKKIYVTGPTATDVFALVGNYNGWSGNMVTFLEGITQRVDAGTIVDYLQGCRLYAKKDHYYGFWEARMADVTIAFMGLTRMLEGEEGEAIMTRTGGDRPDIALPENQVEFIRQMRDKIKDKPLIVVLTGGSAVAIPEILQLADAVLMAWYPGEEGGTALADVLFGDVNPSGRLPVTFYRSVKDLPPFDDYRMQGRTYRYFIGKPEFEFGFGLSYTTFDYKNANTDRTEVTGNDFINLNVILSNSGKYDGEEVIQVYGKKIDPVFFRPVKTLIGFQRVNIRKGEIKEVVIPLDISKLSYWDVEAQQYAVEPGKYEVQIGASSADIRLRTEINIR
ncbi:MAG: glycoside hydrolase family 3 C-terminal domain-containing protein [Bacteroidetes bacterium]|nr:glycoside hydrolase family 3 C-terminal domain-containing protein [Bacteroidota bacterium]